MEVDIFRKKNNVTVAVTGRITSDNFTKLHEVLQSLDYSGLDLTLDFSKLEHITSAGLRVLLMTQKKLPHGRMRIIHVNKAVLNILESTGISQLICTEPDRLEALPDYPSFMQVLDFRSQNTPDKKIFFTQTHNYTWREVDGCVSIIASDLSRLGVHKGSHVAIMSKNSANWLLTFFAIQKLGAIAVLLNFSITPDEVHRYSKSADITHLCYGDISSAIDRKTFARDVLSGDTTIRAIYDIHSSVDYLKRFDELDRLKDSFTERYDPDDPSIMIFTSGSTGAPKSLLYSTYGRMINCRTVTRYFHVTEDDRICLFLPMYHIFGFFSFELSSLYNVPLYLTNGTADAVLIDTIARNRCTILHSVPTKLLSMVQSESFTSEKVSSLRCSFIGGAAISEAQMKSLCAKMPNNHFMPIYGMSESPIISIVDYDDTAEHIAKTVGKPVSGVNVKICKPATGEVCPDGTEGEIAVQSAGGMLCHYKKAAEQQPFDPEGWMRTGDLGLIEPDGYLRITGRIKELIIRGGENISPEEIAAVISELDDIADVKVFGVPDEYYGETVAAAIVMKENCNFDRECVEQHILHKLARFKVPAYYKIYSEFPFLANGKVDILKLKKDIAAKVV